MSAPSQPQGQDAEVQGTFDRIAAGYDTMNRLMTLNRHQAWCSDVARRATTVRGADYLDLATGTGVIARAVQARRPGARVVGADFSEGMLDVARRQDASSPITWQFADAHELPYEDESFDAVTHGYLMRNVSDLDRVLAEQFRVLKPGGVVVALESSPPTGPLAPFVELGMQAVIPTLGTLVAKDPEAYHYLTDSTLGFLTPGGLKERFERAGFTEVAYTPHFLRTNLIWQARKPV
jgi:demethylmenaquinone methyltransferase/2-methoxy-6-polyprenyl-1,4-benzoquinol methylase